MVSTFFWRSFHIERLFGQEAGIQRRFILLRNTKAFAQGINMLLFDCLKLPPIDVGFKMLSSKYLEFPL